MIIHSSIIKILNKTKFIIKVRIKWWRVKWEDKTFLYFLLKTNGSFYSCISRIDLIDLSPVRRIKLSSNTIMSYSHILYPLDTSVQKHVIVIVHGLKNGSMFGKIQSILKKKIIVSGLIGNDIVKTKSFNYRSR